MKKPRYINKIVTNKDRYIYTNITRYKGKESIRKTLIDFCIYLHTLIDSSLNCRPFLYVKKLL